MADEHLPIGRATTTDTGHAGGGHAADREWTHDPLERSFFSTVGRGYLVGMVIFGLFGFLVAWTQAPDWGIGAAIGVGVFVAVFAGILGGVVLIGLWAMKNEELIRGNETGHAEPVHTTTVPEDEPTSEPASDTVVTSDSPVAEDVEVVENEVTENEVIENEVVENEVVENEVVENEVVEAGVEAGRDAGGDTAT